MTSSASKSVSLYAVYLVCQSNLLQGCFPDFMSIITLGIVLLEQSIFPMVTSLRMLHCGPKKIDPLVDPPRSQKGQLRDHFVPLAPKKINSLSHL